MTIDVGVRSRTVIEPAQAHKARIEPFTANHLEMVDFDVRGFPTSFWEGKALTALVGETVLAICGASCDGDDVTVGMMIAPSMADHGYFFNRAVLHGIDGLRLMGFKRVLARCDNENGRGWLRRLGFVFDGEWFVKCLV